MPSGALNKFETNMLVDVDRMVESHGQFHNGGPGKRGLGHITRGGVLLLCAAWELYLEELIVEAVDVCIGRVENPDDLPEPVKHTISDHIRGAKHHFKPLSMAGDGWKTVYRELAREVIAELNTPKAHKVDPIFLKLIGIPSLSACWSVGAACIDEFVKARGDIAHRGRDAGYVTINALRDQFRPQIARAAVETDNAVSTHLHGQFDPHRYPWNRRNL